MVAILSVGCKTMNKSQKGAVIVGETGFVELAEAGDALFQGVEVGLHFLQNGRLRAFQQDVQGMVKFC